MSLNNHFFQLPFTFNLELLKRDLALCLSKEWVEHYRKEEFEGDWQIIALRAVGGFENMIFPSPSKEYLDTPLLQNCPYFLEVLQSLKCSKESVRLMQLAGNSTIKEHTDDCLGYIDGSFRLHIPILSNPEVLFYFENHPVYMEPASCWFGNFTLPHKVENKSDLPRIHIVIDCHRNEWTDNLFEKAGFDSTKDVAAKAILDSPQDLIRIIEELERMDSPTNKALITKLKAQQYKLATY